MNSITPRSEAEALLLEKLQALLADIDTGGVLAARTGGEDDVLCAALDFDQGKYAWKPT